VSRRSVWTDERGFTLIELVLVIVLIGIVVAISSSSWYGVVEGRQVDSATNQLVADLRQAHSRATNRLQTWQVSVTDDSSNYTVSTTSSSSTYDLDEDPGHKIVSDTTVIITFHADGSATVPVGAPTSFRVESLETPSKFNTIHLTTATSRIKVVP